MAGGIIQIPWPVTTAPGARPVEGAGRLINCAAEPIVDGRSVRHRQPGPLQFSATGQTGYRGALLVNNFLYVAYNGQLGKVDNAGTYSSIGALAGTKPVQMARNIKAPTADVAIVTENGAFASDSTGSMAPISWPDPDLPFPVSVCFQDGYFFFGVADRSVWATGLNSTSVDPLSFIKVQSKSNDTLIRVVPHKGFLFIFTSAGCEIWSDTANPSPGFPYSRLSVLDRGLITATAIAGQEDGFGNMQWVGDDCGVYRLTQGLQPEKISPPDLDRLIQAQAKLDPTQLQAGCYAHSGKSFWTISGPSFTWEFNLGTQKWNERASLITGAFTRWRAMFGTLAFNKWIVGDTQSGNLGSIDGGTYTDFGAPQVCRVESGPVADFPVRTRVARADFNFQAGVGIAIGTDPIETDPTVEISWSDDGATSWSVPIMRKLGRQADGRHACYATSLGMSGRFGRRWRLDIADPVHIGHLGGTQASTVRAP